MGMRGPGYLRKTTNAVLDALIRSAERAYQKRPMGVEALREIVATLKDSAEFDEFYRHAWAGVSGIVEDEKLESRRSNAFGRLMIHPVAELLHDGRLDRALLPNIFSFFHLVLGDDGDVFGEQCQEIVSDLRATLGERFSWDYFYVDPRASRIQWRTLVRIAGSFRRWDVRKDWFIKLMQYSPTTVSMGQNAFVVREGPADTHEKGGEVKVFGAREFCWFFQALYEPLTDLSKADTKLFVEEFGGDPHHVIGAFLVNLAACST
jgi:hypothetical protein